MKSESVDLIYIDPPFFTNKNYEIIWGDEAEISSFEDRWEGGINVYIEWMKERILELYRVLKPSGSFYLHCDWHASHYLKVMCDDVFGYNNFRNEIIWHYRRWPAKQRNFQRMHDIILFYSKKHADNTFNEFLEGLSKGTLKRWGGKKSKVEFHEKVRLVTQMTEENSMGRPRDDVWDIPVINSQAKERLGYPTQKPEILLERIISTSSNKDDVVLDAFCGCGTALVMAQKLGRSWIGLDISPSAVALIKNRFAKMGVGEKDYDVTGMPQQVNDLKSFKPFDFQYWVVNEMHGTPSPKKIGDMGIDGLSFLNHHPIQVKQSESVGRNVVDNFETALRRYYKTTKKEMVGYIVAFSFTKGTREEVARAKKEGLKIELIKVQDILDKKFVWVQQTVVSKEAKEPPAQKSLF